MVALSCIQKKQGKANKKKAGRKSEEEKARKRKQSLLEKRTIHFEEGKGTSDEVV